MRSGFALRTITRFPSASISEYPDTARLSLRERFDRAVYIAEPKDIVAVYGAGKRLK